MDTKKAIGIISNLAQKYEVYPQEIMIEAWESATGKEHIFDDFVIMALSARSYCSLKEYKAICFQNEKYFGFVCLNDMTTFKVGLRDAFDSINSIPDENKRVLFLKIIFDHAGARVAIAETLSTPYD